MYGTFLGLFALLAALVGVYVYPTAHLLYRVGRVYESIAPYNNDRCRPVHAPGLEGCEAMALHERSGLAFLACGALATRQLWFMSPGQASTDNDKVFVYHAQSEQILPLALNGFSGTYKALGIDVVESSSHPGHLAVMLVNQAANARGIEIFHYPLPADISDSSAKDSRRDASDTPTLASALTYVETIRHRLLASPHSVAAISDNAFYATNSHRYGSGLLRWVELLTGRPWADVVLRDADGNIKLATKGIAAPTGITLNTAHSEAYVASTSTAAVHAYRVTPAGTLKLRETIALDGFPQQITTDTATGQLYATGILRPLEYFKYIRDPLSSAASQAGFKVWRIQNNTSATRMFGINYHADTVLVEPGPQLPAGSVTVYEPHTQQLLVSSALSPGILLCPAKPPSS
ncbi:hypothetical protein H4R35_006940 [Dimargaris xerosporica]|nr:hypothetical protein H4R35_006940 [Dimargaris xerosporica]